MTKECFRCHDQISLADFYTRKDNTYDTHCKRCRNATRNKTMFPVPCDLCEEHRKVMSNGKCKKCNAIAGLRQCSKCHELLPQEISFSKNGKYFKSTCKTCDRKYYYDSNRKAMLKNYGLTPEDYEMLLVNQEERCAICGETPLRGVLYVDHDHETGKVRGLLCGACNSGLGQFRDDPNVLRAAIDYLIENSIALGELPDAAPYPEHSSDEDPP